ncbi:MAG TPA: acyl-CoA dehydrogenase family protein [Acidimicrobiales bacterium]|nr:acyl-CoA dehydrogenase family protein [Acidimicrobiales bacterium]
MTLMQAATGSEREQALVAEAAAVGEVLAANAARHDAEGSWVEEGYGAVRDAGLLRIAVPEELGGRGATIREVAMVQRELAHHCASTALASAMHQHVCTFQAWRYRRGMPGAEAVLRRIAEEGIVLVSTGGADFTKPRGTATKVDGGYRVSGQKIFGSQSVVGDVLATMFPFDDPEQGKRVLNMSIPTADPGVTVLDNWDTMGMRGTASNDIVIEDVFVPEERVAANRPWGVVDPPLQVIASIAISIVTAVYLGLAEATRDHAVKAAAAKATDPGIQRQIGLMETGLRVAGWAMDGAFATVGDDPDPSMENVAAVMAAKRAVTDVGLQVCDLAIEVAGGAAYFKGSPIERAYRDMRGVKFHPFQPEAILLHAGRLALGQPCDDI